MIREPLGWEGFNGDSLYLDANIIIFAVEAGNRWFPTLCELFEAIDERAILAVTSELTVAEVLAKPLQLAARDLVATYQGVLQSDGVIEVVPIDRSILVEAARLRGKLGLKLMDAIHLATALHRGCDVLLTNDDRFRKALGSEIKGIDLWEVTGEKRSEA